jgi:serine-type D-Ala-D-Ala carboxypeptidase/endopeptidase (penicillin-binding protein 4)
MIIRKTTWLQALLWTCASLCAQGREPSQSPAQTLSELRQQLTALVSQPRYDAALWGVKVVSLDTGKTLFEDNARKLFSPASNCKLYTVALALERLGPDYRIRTSLYSNARPDAAGSLRGDLIVYGRGDPTINARLHGGDILQAFQPLVSALTNAGVREIRGDLVGDASFIRGPAYGSGWSWDDAEYYYGAEISALTVNDNILRISVQPGRSVGAPCLLGVEPVPGYITFMNQAKTVARGQRRDIGFYRPLSGNVVYVSGKMPLGGSAYTDDVTVHNPAGLFVLLLRDALARQGIRVEGRLRTINWLERQASPLNGQSLVELGSIESPPVRDLARLIEKPSQNLYDDLLLAQVGERSRTPDTPPNLTSEELGIAALDQFLPEAGIPRGDVFFEEGSGLSRNNLATPRATVALLRFMSRTPNAKAYFDALPIAGVDGTLRYRMKGTPAEGDVHAKTGSLRWAVSLSGYLRTAAGERLAFSIMLNRYHNTEPNRSSRADLDKIAELLAGFGAHTTE